MPILALLAGLLLLALPNPASAQQRQCDLSAPGRTENVGNQVIVLHDPFTVVCDDGARIRANSGRWRQLEEQIELTGDVHFEDSDRALTADEATYYRSVGRLWARGNVVFVNRVEGSTLRGPELEYYRQTDERPLAQVLATRRPELTIEPDEEDPEGEPLVVVADRLLILGDDDLSAFDSVVITRTDMRATSAEARYNSTTEDLELRGDAVIVSDDYTLAGEVIQADLTDGSLEHVHARTRARVEGDDLFVEAPDLQLFFAADTLRRAVAVSPADLAERKQALARSESFQLTADSIDAAFVEQKIREVHAIGSARAVTSDSTAQPLPMAGGEPGAAPGAVGQGDAGIAEPADGAIFEPPDTATSRGAPSAEPRPRGGQPPTAQPSDTNMPAGSDTPGAEPSDTTAAPDLAPGRAEVVAAALALDADWVKGDTVIGYFEPVVAATDSVATDPAEADTAATDQGDADEIDPGGDVELRRLVAIGSAQSLYRMAPEGDPDSPRRNVNFLVGARIELDMVDGELSVASVKGLERGIYLEAAADPEPAVEVPDAIPPDPGAPDAAPPPQGLG